MDVGMIGRSKLHATALPARMLMMEKSMSICDITQPTGPSFPSLASYEEGYRSCALPRSGVEHAEAIAQL